jgi:hypothetical protein
MPIEESPKKAVYQIVLAVADKMIFNKSVIAYTESEAIEKVKVGSVIKELGYKREDVDFFIKIVGHLYEGETFATALAKTPILTTDEISALGVKP